MRRKFEPFDHDIIRREILDLPAEDHKRLTLAMKAFQMDLGVGYKVKKYRDGIEMITDAGDGQGRAIYFARTEESLVVRLIYKKESQKLPRKVIELAKQRLRKYLANG